MIKNSFKKGYLLILFVLSICLCGCSAQEVLKEFSGESGQNIVSDAEADQSTKSSSVSGADSATLASIPEFSGDAYIMLDDNIPDFDKEDYSEKAFERYSKLDSLGRCGVAYANIGQELMPTEEREAIGPVRPTGWHTVKYNCVDGKYLYNRCHLIGFQLSGENANEKNLITGTRYMNVEGMLPFENEVADYVNETNHHVLYRVTPIYEGNDLVAKGVQMEAYSVEDDGEGVCFNVFVYNNQPGIEIDYATGESCLEGKSSDKSNSEESKSDAKQKTTSQTDSANQSGTKKAAKQEKNAAENNTSETSQEYVLNTNTHKFHLPSCSSVGDMNAENKKTLVGTREELESQGYEACKRCLR